METEKNNRSRKLFTIVSQTRLFTDQIITICPFPRVPAVVSCTWSLREGRPHMLGSRRQCSRPNYSLPLYLETILLMYFAASATRSRLNFQHIHYSVFPAVVSSSFHLSQIHRLIKTRKKKIHNFYGSALDIGLAQRTVSRTNSIR